MNSKFVASAKFTLSNINGCNLYSYKYKRKSPVADSTTGQRPCARPPTHSRDMIKGLGLRSTSPPIAIGCKNAIGRSNAAEPELDCNPASSASRDQGSVWKTHAKELSLLPGEDDAKDAQDRSDEGRAAFHRATETEIASAVYIDTAVATSVHVELVGHKPFDWTTRINIIGT